MDVGTQRILAIFGGLTILSIIGGITLIAVVHDGTIVGQVVTAFQQIAAAALAVAGPIIMFVLHIKQPASLKAELTGVGANGGAGNATDAAGPAGS